MKILKRILFNKEENIVKRTYIWNLLANLFYSLQSAVLLLIITRYGGVIEGGIFSIIYTTTHMFAAIGNYNMRNYQVSDARDKFIFCDYWTSRVISGFLMCIVGVVYALIRFDSINSILVVLCFVGYRLTEAIEDVIHGYIQKSGRLDVASMGKTIRIIVASMVFIVSYIILNSLLLASLLLFLSSLSLLIVFIFCVNSEYGDLRYNLEFRNIVKLLWECLPLCLSALLQSYIVNAPKYAIDAVLSPEYQTVFNILFMPLFAINVLSMFIFNPLVARMGEWWVNNDKKPLRNCIFKQIVIVIGFTGVASVLGYLIGCEILGFIYGVDLKQYKGLFFLLILFGGISALVTFFTVIATIIRKQFFIIVAYMIATIFSICLSRKIVYLHGIYGASILYGILMGIIVIILCIVIITVFIKKRRS